MLLPAINPCLVFGLCGYLSETILCESGISAMTVDIYLIPVELGCMEPFEAREKNYLAQLMPDFGHQQVLTSSGIFRSSPSKTNLETWTWTLEKGGIPIGNHHFVPQEIMETTFPPPWWTGVVPTCEGDHQGSLLCHLVDLLSWGDLKHLAIFRTSVDGFWSTMKILFNKDQYDNSHVLTNKIQWSSFGIVFFVSWCSWCFMKWVGISTILMSTRAGLGPSTASVFRSLALCLCHESLLDFHQQANEPKGLRKKVGVYIEGFRDSPCYMKRWKSSLNHLDHFSSIFRNQASDSWDTSSPNNGQSSTLTLGLDRHWLAIFSSFGRLLPAKAQVKGLRTPWTKASRCSTIKHPLKPWRTQAAGLVLKTLTVENIKIR